MIARWLALGLVGLLVWGLWELAARIQESGRQKNQFYVPGLRILAGAIVLLAAVILVVSLF